MPRSSRRPCLLLLAFASLCAPTLLPAQIGGKITELGSGGRSFNDAKPDLAYDPSNNYYAHVFAGTTTPRSIRLKLFDATTGAGVQGGDVAMSPGTNDHGDPCVAYIAKTGMFLVAWQVNNGSDWDIECRAYDPTSKTLGSIVSVAATAADEITPDLASESTQADDDAVLVWDDESVGIRGAEIEVQSATVVKVLAPTTLAAGAKPLHDNPKVSRSGGAARRIAVAWESAPTSMAVTAFTMDLAAASTPFAIPVSGSLPDLDGNGSEFLVLFQRPQPSSSTLSDVWCCSVRIPVVAQIPMTQVAAPAALAANANDERNPTVAFVGGSYLAAWAVVNTNDQFGKCRVQTLTPDCATCGTGWLFQYGGRQRTVEWQAVASEYNSDATTTARRGRVMYDTGWIRNGAPASLLQKVNYEVVGGPKVTLASGCGTGGTLSIPEPFAFGENITAELTGAAANATSGVFVVGVPGARPQFPCSTCNILLGPYLFAIAVTNGNAQWSARIPCDPIANNFELDFQYVVFTPGTTPCPILQGLSASNILRATVQ